MPWPEYSLLNNGLSNSIPTALPTLAVALLMGVVVAGFSLDPTLALLRRLMGLLIRLLQIVIPLPISYEWPKRRRGGR